MFADRAKILIRSGKGGDGHVSFRREAYVPAGGPDGGDGGKGGDIIFEADKGLNTLGDYRHGGKYCAGAGGDGQKKCCHGKNGADRILKVPEGTIVREADTGRVIADLSGENRRQIVLAGGRGGKGNKNYATPTMQAPNYAQPGQSARELWVELELKVIADVGLAGFPNVGKSTFLARVTNARPKIAAYPFTTLNPNLGVVDLEDGRGFVIADIPGLIEGASEGVGLGHEFLRHIERTKVLIHMVDVSASEGRDPLTDIGKINEELRAYNPALVEKPQVIAANKTDLLYAGDEDPVARIRKKYEPQGIRVFPISAVSGRGVSDLLHYVRALLDDLPQETVVFAQEFDPNTVRSDETLPYTVARSDGEEHLFLVEGARIERMLGYTNLESEKGFQFFQNFLRDNGILDDLEAAGIEEGDTVSVCGLQFDYYK